MKRKTVVLGVVVLLAALILAVKYVGDKRAAAATLDPPLNLTAAFREITESGKPSVVVFSYDADCCETTKAFFNEYNTKAKAFLEEQKNKSNTLFVNTGVLDEEQVTEFLRIANETGITEVPCILLLDASGKPVQVLTGPFDAVAVTEAIRGTAR